MIRLPNLEKRQVAQFFKKDRTIAKIANQYHLDRSLNNIVQALSEGVSVIDSIKREK